MGRWGIVRFLTFYTSFRGRSGQVDSILLKLKVNYLKNQEFIIINNIIVIKKTI